MSDFRFPIDCPLECKFHKAWDLSVDDWTHVCTKLNIQIDEYDCGFTGLLPICPIEREPMRLIDADMRGEQDETD